MNFPLVALFLFNIFAIAFFLVFAYRTLFLLVIPALSFGAVFANSTPQIIETMISLAKVTEGTKAVDLGSGDGRLVIALARAGAEAHGYEINPFLVLQSRISIKKAGLTGKAFVHWQSFWNKDFHEFDIVALYTVAYVMNALAPKLKTQLKPGARIVSNYFVFSDWQPSQTVDSVHLYYL